MPAQFIASRSAVDQVDRRGYGHAVRGTKIVLFMVERTKEVDMRNGYKVYDSDTHIRPGAGTLETYLSARVRELVLQL